MLHINIQEPDAKLNRKILEEFPLAAAEAIKTHCGQEYRFANENEKTRATVRSELHIDELEDLPTNNIRVERGLLKFDCLSKVGKSHNHKFKAKAITNSMNLKLVYTIFYFFTK